ncbi:MAG: site-specific integrase [Myxococcales bacterium]|nr:site-specific integrase [Myxococcales bacterium]
MTSIRARPSTRKNYGTMFRNHLVPVLGAIPLDEIDKRAIEPLLSRPGLAASTTNNIIHALKSVLKYARELGHVAELPEIKRLREEQLKTEDERWWTRPELDAILRVARERSLQDYVFALLGAHAGLRVSEIITLRWLDVSFEKRSLLVRRNLSANCETTPKGKRARSIPMTGKLRAALQALFEEHGPGGHVLKGEAGGRWTKGMAEWSILKSSRMAGVDEGRPHKLRHTCGSLLGRDGWTAKQISYFLGHSNPATSQRYIHTHRDDLASMAGSLDAPRKPQ